MHILRTCVIIVSLCFVFGVRNALYMRVYLASNVGVNISIGQFDRGSWFQSDQFTLHLRIHQTAMVFSTLAHVMRRPDRHCIERTIMSVYGVCFDRFFTWIHVEKPELTDDDDDGLRWYSIVVVYQKHALYSVLTHIVGLSCVLRYLRAYINVCWTFVE